MGDFNENMNPSDFTFRECEDVIGEGGFGIVYKCQHKQLGVVAVKLIRPKDSESQRKLQKEEADLCKKLKDCKHVIHAFGCFILDETFGIVMEYAERGNLEDLRRRTNLPWKLRIRMMHETASGLAEMHSLNAVQRITHNDLKPANILINGGFHAKIGDLGASNIAKHSTRISFNEYDGTYGVCTPYYTAPEFILARVEIARRTSMDVYSFGMVLYFVITGERPFKQYTWVKCTDAYKKKEDPTFDEDKIKSKLTRDEEEDFDTLYNLMKQCGSYDIHGRGSMNEVKVKLGQSEIEIDVAKLQERLSQPRSLSDLLHQDLSMTGDSGYQSSLRSIARSSDGD